MIYLDSNYIARYYLKEHGSSEVLKLINQCDGVCSLALSKTECIATFKRHFREDKINIAGLHKAVEDFSRDEKDGFWHFFPINNSILQITNHNICTIPKEVYIRSADALHLTCAKEEGFSEIYTHDKNMLKAAEHFGLTGIDIIPLEKKLN